ncbi:MAG TPA: ABC transporter permease [Tepidisphaeraceae bacterium]|nr:ABC transporter permease [Tepidisphaeraceae bacterium]
MEAELQRSIGGARLRLARMQELGLIAIILAMGAVLSWFGYRDAAPGGANLFLNPDNLIDIVATDMSYYAIMAVGMTFVIVSGGIDISVGSSMALSGLAAAAVLQQFPRSAPAWEVLPVAMIVPLGVGLLCGLVNGLLIVGLRLQPFIATLATMGIFRGIALVAPRQKTLPVEGKYLPAAFFDHFMRHEFWSLRLMPMAIMLIVVVVAGFYLSQTIGGREIYAVGGNEEAARFSGIRTHRVQLRVYMVAGLTAGIAAMVLLGKLGSISVGEGDGFELTVIAATVVGGASLSGGRGSVLGALLGTLIFALVKDGMDIVFGSTDYQKIIVGCAIVVAVGMDILMRHLRLRKAGRGMI